MFIKSKNEEKEINTKSEIFDWVISIGIAFLVVIIIRTFFLGVAIVEGPSMLNTIHQGDRVFFQKNAKPVKNDIVVVNTENNIKIIKRVIGTSGDRVEIKQGELYLNGKKKKENYIKEKMEKTDMAEIEIPKGEIFVMGDNRNVSADSRVYGTFDVKNDYLGRVFYHY